MESDFLIPLSDFVWNSLTLIPDLPTMIHVLLNNNSMNVTEINNYVYPFLEIGKNWGSNKHLIHALISLWSKRIMKVVAPNSNSRSLNFKCTSEQDKSCL